MPAGCIDSAGLPREQITDAAAERFLFSLTNELIVKDASSTSVIS